jgi:O-antigen/teichoic acid export membrane protein
MITAPTTLTKHIHFPMPARIGQSVAALLLRLKTDVMLQKSLLSLCDQAVVSALNFAVTIILSRATGKIETGLYYLAIQCVFFGRGMQEQLIAAPYMIYSQKKTSLELKRYAGSTLTHEVLFLFITACSIAAVTYFGYFSIDLQNVLHVLIFAAPLMLLREFTRQMAFADLRVVEALCIDSSVTILQLSGMCLAWYCGVLSTATTYVILATGCACVSLAWFVLKRGSFQVQAADIASDWKDNWKFSRWALATQLLGCSAPYALPWIVASVHGASATASFGVSATLVGFANMFVLGMSNFVCPLAAREFSQSGKSGLVKVLLRMGGIYLLVLGCFALSMMFLGQQFMQCIYGAEFADAGPILAVLACGALANSLGILAGNGLWAMERPAANFRADLTAVTVWFMSAYWLIPTCGPLGAAYASLLGIFVSACVRMLTLSQVLNEKKQ